MNNHVAYYSLAFAKYPLTNAPVSRRMKSLTKTISGHRSRQTSGFFMSIVWAYSRLYDGLRRPNIIPLGNKSRRLIAVSETRRLIKVTLSKLKLSGEHYYA